MLGVLRACQRGLGIALLPDYLVEENGGLVQLFGEERSAALDAYFVYPEELKSVARVQVFRDFLVEQRAALELSDVCHATRKLTCGLSACAADMRASRCACARRAPHYSSFAVALGCRIPPDKQPCCGQLFPSGR